MAIVGFDPGKSGAICCLEETAVRLEVRELLAIPLKISPSYTTALIAKKKVKPKKPKVSEMEIDFIKIRSLLETWNDQYGIEMVSLELQQAFTGGRPNKGGAENMRNFGILEGILIGMNLPYRIWAPKEWQALYPPLEVPSWIDKWALDDIKKQSITTVTQLFPWISLLETPHCKKPSDAYSDSILIAYSHYLSEVKLIQQAA